MGLEAAGGLALAGVAAGRDAAAEERAGAEERVGVVAEDGLGFGVGFERLAGLGLFASLAGTAGPCRCGLGLAGFAALGLVRRPALGVGLGFGLGVAGLDAFVTVCGS